MVQRKLTKIMEIFVDIRYIKNWGKGVIYWPNSESEEHMCEGGQVKASHTSKFRNTFCYKCPKSEVCFKRQSFT